MVKSRVGAFGRKKPSWADVSTSRPIRRPLSSANTWKVSMGAAAAVVVVSDWVMVLASVYMDDTSVVNASVVLSSLEVNVAALVVGSIEAVVVMVTSEVAVVSEDTT